MTFPPDSITSPDRSAANGCEVNRDTAAVIDAAGFSSVDHETIDIGRAGAYARIQLIGTATR